MAATDPKRSFNSRGEEGGAAELKTSNSLPAIRLLLLTASLGIAGCDNQNSEQTAAQRIVGESMYFTHPVLGELYPEDVDWYVDEASVSFHASRPQVCLAEGTEEGPSDSASAGFYWIAANWEQVQTQIETQAFEFYQPYADAVASVPMFESPNELWGTERLLSLRVFAADDFSVTLRFDWQEESDPHEVTFYVEGGICKTHSVDG